MVLQTDMFYGGEATDESTVVRPLERSHSGPEFRFYETAAGKGFKTSSWKSSLDASRAESIF